jgi:hypothetical protein
MEQPQSEVQLENSVVAIFGRDRADAALEALEAAGSQVLQLSGPGDIDKLAPNQDGAKGTISRVAAAFGDELRILEEMERALRNGHQVLIVRGNRDEHANISRNLTELGATSVWEFGGWTFTKTGEDKSQ